MQLIDAIWLFKGLHRSIAYIWVLLPYFRECKVIDEFPRLADTGALGVQSRAGMYDLHGVHGMYGICVCM